MRRERRRSDRAARHAHVARVPAAVGRRGVRARSCASTATPARWSATGRDGKLVLSHFAGERPNLFEATLQCRRHARGHAERQRALSGRAQQRGARQGHSRAAGSVALHQRQGSDRRRFISLSRSDRQDRLEHRRAVPRQGRDPGDRRQLVPELPRRGAVPRRSCTRTTTRAGSRSSG